VKTNFIKFLGTAGARFVMIRQLRASGGIWININGANMLLDPGPGSLIQCHKHAPLTNPETLDAIILSHKHIDHCSDVNVMIEAMTEGGFKKRGTVFCPADAIEGDPAILKYAQKLPQEIVILKEKARYEYRDFSFETSMRHIHSSETYGLKFHTNNGTLAFLTDTKYFPELTDFYKADIVIISTVFYNIRPDVDHLSVHELKNIIPKTNAKKIILTHFGLRMLEHGPSKAAEELSKEFGIEIAAAEDGMEIALKS